MPAARHCGCVCARACLSARARVRARAHGRRAWTGTHPPPGAAARNRCVSHRARPAALPRMDTREAARGGRGGVGWVKGHLFPVALHGVGGHGHDGCPLVQPGPLPDLLRRLPPESPPARHAPLATAGGARSPRARRGSNGPRRR